MLVDGCINICAWNQESWILHKEPPQTVMGLFVLFHNRRRVVLMNFLKAFEWAQNLNLTVTGASCVGILFLIIPLFFHFSSFVVPLLLLSCSLGTVQAILVLLNVMLISEDEDCKGF